MERKKILPFGPTLHYAGCGCPSTWQQGTRVADQVDALVLRTLQLFQRKLISPNRPLRVCYMLPHHNITGGMKCLVEHIRLLRQRGHYTIAVHRSDTAQRAMPPWTTVEAGKEATCCTSHSPACVVPHVKRLMVEQQGCNCSMSKVICLQMLFSGHQHAQLATQLLYAVQMSMWCAICTSGSATSTQYKISTWW